MKSNYFIGNREYFPGIQKIQYEGPESDNPLAFKHYDENKVIGDKSMKDHLRFSRVLLAYFLWYGRRSVRPGNSGVCLE